MSVRFDNLEAYVMRFGVPEPQYYMQHLSDEEYNNIPIDPEALVKDVPACPSPSPSTPPPSLPP